MKLMDCQSVHPVIAVVAWCCKNSKNCCKKEDMEVPGVTQPALQVSSRPFSALQAPMSPPSDIQLALFRMNQQQQQNQLELQMQQQQQQQ